MINFFASSKELPIILARLSNNVANICSATLTFNLSKPILLSAIFAPASAADFTIAFIISSNAIFLALLKSILSSAKAEHILS